MFKFMLKLYITREITRENIIELRLKYMYTTYPLHSTLCHIIITYVEKWDIFAYIYQLSLWRKNISSRTFIPDMGCITYMYIIMWFKCGTEINRLSVHFSTIGDNNPNYSKLLQNSFSWKFWWTKFKPIPIDSMKIEESKNNSVLY